MRTARGWVSPLVGVFVLLTVVYCLHRLLWPATTLSLKSEAGSVVLTHVAASAGSLLGSLLVAKRNPASNGHCPLLGLCSTRASPRRALVHIAVERDSLKKMFGLILAERTLGKWSDEIVLLVNEEQLQAAQSLKRCYQVRVVFCDKEQLQSFIRTVPAVNIDPSLWHLLPLVVPELREYDIVSLLDEDVVISGPLALKDPEDFESSITFLIEQSSVEASKILPDFIQSRLPDPVRIITNDVRRRLSQASGASSAESSKKVEALSADGYSVITRRLENPMIISGVLADCASKLYPLTSGGNAAFLMLCFLGRWRTVYTDAKWRTDPAQFLTSSPKYERTAGSLGYIRGYRSEVPANPKSPLNRYFALMTAAAKELCPSLRPSLASTTEEKKLSSDYVQQLVAYSVSVLETNFDGRMPLLIKPRASSSKLRAFIYSSYQRSLKGAFSILFNLRAVGLWEDDIILVTDEINDEERSWFACLNVKIMLFAFEEFQMRFTAARKNVIFYKAAPLFMTSLLQTYEILQYFGEEGLVSGPVRKAIKSDFGDQSVVTLELLGCQQPRHYYTNMLLISVQTSRLPEDSVLAKDLDIQVDKKIHDIHTAGMLLTMLFGGKARVVRNANSCDGSGTSAQQPLRFTHSRPELGTSIAATQDAVLFHSAFLLAQRLSKCQRPLGGSASP
jgi:hypothetical protein